MVRIAIAAALLLAVAFPIILAQQAQAVFNFPGYNGALIYEGDDGDIYKVNADGTDLVNLTNDPGQDSKPSWSSDGTKIIFTSDRSGTSSIYVMDLNGNNVTMVSNGVDAADQPSFSYDGTRIAYRQNGDDLVVANADGSAANQIVTGSVVRYVWAPSGLQLGYSYEDPDDDSIDLMAVNVDGTNPYTVLETESMAFYQSWAPDGNKIAYALFDTDTYTGELYSINPDGTDNFQVTHTGSSLNIYVGSSSWSQDSTRIAFAILDLDTSMLNGMVVNADGTNQHIVLSNVLGMSWSPDNTQLLALGADPGTGALVTANPDGSNRQDIMATSNINFGITLPFSWQPLTIPPTSNQPNPSLPYTGSPLTYDVPANTTDAYGGVAPSSVTITEQPTQGTVTIDSVTGIITYTSNANATAATDYFTYRVCSGASDQLCAINTITITGIPVGGSDGGGELAPTGMNTYALIAITGGVLIGAAAVWRTSHRARIISTWR